MARAKKASVSTKAKITSQNVGPIKVISAEINAEFEIIKKEAIEAAQKDKCNYNIIFNNPTVNGEFDLRNSKFEYVKDTHFLYNRPHIKFVCKTDDLIK